MTITETRLIIVMGVSGCGKSTVAEAIAKQLNYAFIEADDFHSVENKAHMRSGQALTDDMREPWVDKLREHITQMALNKTSCVMSFSGLKASHRERIRSAPIESITLHLNGKKELIESRMRSRRGHFMPTSLLDSQFLALEDPSNEANTINIDIDCTVDQLIARALEALR